ncbi:MAG: excinuclease ABC subunit UvrC [bacterium]
MEKIFTAPTSPGVYLFKNALNKPVYVGKAKNIRNRLKSYLASSRGLDIRKQEMIRSAKDVSFIVTENELEALALEANLIKQNKPRYNVILRDDKNYPYLRIDLTEEWPHLEIVRRIKKDRALYFGPYIPASGMHETLALIRKFFRVRLCRYSLTREMRPCVQYQMGRCPAPCANLVSKEEYEKTVDEVISFLKGRNKGLLDLLRKEMQTLSERQMYEEAAEVRDRIQAIEKIWDSQKVVSPRINEMDIIGYHVKAPDAAFVVLFIRNGIMTGSKEFFLQNAADIEPGELIHTFIEMFYSGPVMPPAQVLVQQFPDDRQNLETWLSERKGKRVVIAASHRGLKRNLIKMASENASVFIEHYKVKGHEPVLQEIQKRLGLSRLPESIGAFDVSTLHGADSIGAFIVWENGHFQKRFYRSANIRTVEGMDDFAMMRESVVRIVNNIKGAVPDLIIIDGGKGQLDAALKGFSELGLSPMPAVIAIAKDPDRVFAEWLDMPVGLEDGSPSSLLLKRIRDEAHRFVITRHRKARKRKLLTSSLEDIRGIGKKRRLALLKQFGSIDAIRDASLEEIAAVKGLNRDLAQKIKDFLSEQ